ncbi:MAG: hypothetical protein IKH34_04620, partial [Oscillospiraceae bacterium]|nr:hypothetical protein [Oscillospiraceae bacterium]
KEIFGEFVQSANSPNIFSRQYSVLPGGGEPLPYGGDWAMRLFCNSPFDGAPGERTFYGVKVPNAPGSGKR